VEKADGLCDGSQTRSFCHVSDEARNPAPLPVGRSVAVNIGNLLIYHSGMRSTSLEVTGSPAGSHRTLAQRLSKQPPSRYHESANSIELGAKIALVEGFGVARHFVRKLLRLAKSLTTRPERGFEPCGGNYSRAAGAGGQKLK